MRKISTFLFLTIITLSISQTTMAEEGWHFGPTVGYENTSVIVKYNEDEESYTNLSGFNIGGLAEYRPLNWLGIESGVQFVMNGYWLKGYYQSSIDPSVRGDAELKNNLYYLMFPLYVEGLIPITDNFSINIECGPEFYAGLDSKTSLTIHGTAGLQDYSETWYQGIFDETLSRFNCDIHLAGGIQYAGFRLMAGYNFGVYNMFLDGKFPIVDPDPKHPIDRKTDSFKMSGFVINISYLF